MKSILTALVLGVTILLASGGGGYAQDFQKGVEAYDKGDYATALRELRPLAEQGNADAQNNLGAMYQGGLGALQDDVYAHMWFNIAASNGHDNARSNRDLAAKRMTTEQLTEAQKLARECVRKNYKDC